MRRTLTLSVAAALAVALAAAAPEAGKLPETIDPALIPNYKLINPGLAVAGQPSAEALLKLREYGFRTVINLRTAEEGAETEGEKIKALGLTYIWVPVTPASFSLKDVEAVQQVLSEAGAAPVLLHCGSSNRVGGVIAAAAASKGSSLEAAEAQGRAAGLRSAEMIEAVRRVVQSLPAKQ